MVAYADDVVMWTWVFALLGTLVAFAVAWRSLQRAEVALARASDGLEGLRGLDAAVDELDGATRAAAGERVRLHTRASDV